jgi:hypothetical protein
LQGWARFSTLTVENKGLFFFFAAMCDTSTQCRTFCSRQRTTSYKDRWHLAGFLGLHCWPIHSTSDSPIELWLWIWRLSVFIPPDHLLLDSAPNLGPLISRWKMKKYENSWYKSVRILEALKLLYQQFLNLSSSQRDMSSPILGALSNNTLSWGTCLFSSLNWILTKICARVFYKINLHQNQTTNVWIFNFFFEMHSTDMITLWYLVVHTYPYRITIHYE